MLALIRTDHWLLSGPEFRQIVLGCFSLLSSIRTGCLHFSTVAILGHTLLCSCWGLVPDCRMFKGLPGHYSLLVISNFPPIVTIQNLSRHCQMVLWGKELPAVKNHCLTGWPVTQLPLSFPWYGTKAVASHEGCHCFLRNIVDPWTTRG